MDKHLFWHQGLFLQPQHLQLNDRKTHSMLTPYHTYIKPCLTGVVSMATDEKALNHHTFEIISGEFWFQDMTFVSLGKNAFVESRDFRNNLTQEKPTTVFLGLKKWKNERPNVTTVTHTATNKIADTRFAVLEEPETIADMYQAGDSAEVHRMFYALRIFFEDELSNVTGYDLIPIARITGFDNGAILSGSYIPPCVTAGSSPSLFRICRNIADTITSCSFELSSFKRKLSIHGLESDSKKTFLLMVLMTLNRHIPFFQDVVKEPASFHPRDVYAVTCQLIAELASFSETTGISYRYEKDSITSVNEQSDTIAHNVFPYQHEDLWSCFSNAEIILNALISELTSGSEHIIPVHFNNPYYTCVLNENLLKTTNSFYLVIRSSEDPNTVVNAIGTELKAASPSLIETLVERSLPGISVKYLPIPPDDLPRIPRGIYFRLENHGDVFQQMLKEGQLSLFWYSPPDNLKMDLIAVT